MNEKSKRGLEIAANVLLYIVLAVALFSVIMAIVSKKDPDGAATVFGYQMRIVTSDSMGPCEYTDVSDFQIKSIPVSSLVFVQVMPEDKAAADDWYRSLRVGDVLTFRFVYTTQVTITHRIIAIEENADGFKIQLAGDNKSSEYGQLIQEIDTSVPNNTDYVIGKVTGQSYLLGVIMSFLMSKLGMILIIIAPCALIILFEFLKIAKVLNGDKKAREQSERDEQEKELIELRRKLAELEQTNSAQPAVNQEEGKEE
jgi:hypothetical protein